MIFQSFNHEEVVGLKFGYQPIGKPRLFSHIYFVDGLLIDTGQSKVRSAIISEVSKLAVEQIFITHHHEDHTGNIAEVKELHACNGYASERCCQMMKDPPRLSFAQKIIWGDRAGQPDLILKYDTIETNKFSFHIISIPGHAPDMVALYEPNRQWLFSADLYINSYIDYILTDESIADQIASIRKILQLDFKEMFCSHKPQLRNGKQQLAKKLNFLESFFNEVSVLYQQGYSANEIFRSLRLKENWVVRVLSGGKLSKLNMVKSVIRDLQLQKV